MENKFDIILNHAKQYGFVYQGSEIYNGLSNTWDYGPLGIEMKNALKQLWYKEFVTKDPKVVGIDSSIILNPNVWKSSGHIGGFSDPLIDCKNCRNRYRADKLIEGFDNKIVADGWSNEKLSNFIIDNNIECPNCKKVDYTSIRQFNLMFKSSIGVVEDASSEVYLRPETAQGIFINFKNVARTTRMKVPFGVGQIGKSFRNEISPGNFIFRTREFEQMELEFFTKPGTEIKWFDFYQQKMLDFLKLLNIKTENIKIHEHASDELSHYSNKTIDLEYNYPFGFSELWGLASRTDFDLKSHQEGSGVDLSYRDPHTNEVYLPYVIEPSVGVDRLMLAILCDAYEVETLEDDTTREVMKLSYHVAPIQVAILPLVKKLSDNAMELYTLLSDEFRVDFDETQTIGKRYRRQDVIGTPYCITYDYDSIEDNCVTVRERDSMNQNRVLISDLVNYIKGLNK